MSNLEKLVSAYCHTSVDFAASTVAFMESQKKKIDCDAVETKVPEDHKAFFKRRLAHYRSIYKPQ
ncbi:DNA polymerase III subunit theta [Edaphovirga cremea]|uniref:DNA polymerase III subunit theta n=1 Tax=Edaphovirga cremea TaxID=2267246 RepID=UPI000DEFBDAF|nr:DNA polymerase III subunit theta [Edaphovirga cremea]